MFHFASAECSCIVVVVTGKTVSGGHKMATEVKVKSNDLMRGEGDEGRLRTRAESVSTTQESRFIRATTKSYVRRAETISRALHSLHERRSVHRNK